MEPGQTQAALRGVEGYCGNGVTVDGGLTGGPPDSQYFEGGEGGQGSGVPLRRRREGGGRREEGGGSVN